MSDDEYQPILLGPRYAVKLKDLEEHHLVRIHCFMCQHSSIILPSRLLKMWPPYTNIMMLENYMVCSKCRNRTENRWEVVIRRHL